MKNKKKIKVSVLLVIEKANKCRDLAEFKRRFPTSYRWVSARPEGLRDLHQLFQNKPEPILTEECGRKWSVSSSIELARKYSSRIEFKTNHKGAFEFLRRKKKLYLLESIFPTAHRETWTEEKVLALSRKYRTKYLFREAHHGAYKWMKARGLIHLLKFETSYVRWNFDTALAESQKFKSLTEFRINKCGAYEYLLRNHKEELSKIY